MDELLFNKVFKNKYLFNIIFNFVHFINDKDDSDNNSDSYQEYSIDEFKSRNYMNINLSDFISNKQYKLFDYWFDVIFNHQSQQQQQQQDYYLKYWYYRINYRHVLHYYDASFKNHLQIFNVFEYKELGISRFKQYYYYFLCGNSSGYTTGYYNYLVLKHSFKSGNMEIIDFILNLSSFNYNTLLHSIFYNFNFKHSCFNVNGYYDNIKDALKLLECGNSVLVYNKIIESINQDGLELINKQINIAKIIDYFSKLNYDNLYPLLIEKLELPTFLSVINISLKNQDIKLANEIIKSPNFKNAIISFAFKFDHYLFKNLNSLKFTFTEKYYNILILYLLNSGVDGDKYSNLFIKKCPKIEISDQHLKNGIIDQEYIYTFNLNNENNIELSKSLISNFVDSFYPNSLQEFKLIESDQGLIERFYKGGPTRSNYALTNHITTYIQDLEFFKYWVEIHSFNTNFNLSIKNCLNSSNEIFKWAKSENEQSTSFLKALPPLEVLNTSNLLVGNAFYGNLENLKYTESIFGIKLANYEIFRESCKRGYLEIVKYLLPNLVTPSIAYIDFAASGLLTACKFNQYSIIKYLSENLTKQAKDKVYIYADVDLPNKAIHYLMSKNLFNIHKFINSPNPNTILYQDYQIFKFVFKLKIQFIQDHLYRFLIKSRNFKIFQFLIDNILNGKLILPPSRIFIIYLIRENQKKLIYFLNSSINLFIQFYEIIIKKSIIQFNNLDLDSNNNNLYFINNSNNNSIYILNQILLLSNNYQILENQELLIFLKIIYYLILFKSKFKFEISIIGNQLLLIHQRQLSIDTLLKFNNQFKNSTKLQLKSNIDNLTNNEIEFLNSIGLKDLKNKI